MSIDDFNIAGEPIPSEIEYKIEDYHIKELEPLTDTLKVYPSAKSGYRPKSWELSHGRSGNSQHTFEGKGATDWTCDDFEDNKDTLLNFLITSTAYLRITIYNTFIHCDYKDTHNGKRLLFESGSNSKWTFKKFI